MPSLSSLDNLDRFFYKRYDVEVDKVMEPLLHGDAFVARSASNVVFGDYLSAPVFSFVGGTSTLDTR